MTISDAKMSATVPSSNTNMGSREILHVMVVGAQKTTIKEARQTRKFVGAGADGGGSDWPPVPRSSLNALQIESGGQRVDSLADQSATAVAVPKAVSLAV